MKYPWNTKEEYKAMQNALVKEHKMELEAFADAETFEERQRHIDKSITIAKQLADLDTLHKQWIMDGLEKERTSLIKRFKKELFKRAGVA